MKTSVLDPLERYAARRDRGHAIEVETPEGLHLGFSIAPVGDRLAAFLIDGCFIALWLISFGLCIWVTRLAFGATLYHWVSAIAAVATFFVTNFYFAWYEMRRRGSTPGKRYMHLRVIDATGDPLRGGALLARNLSRIVEFGMPIAVFSSLQEDPRLNLALLFSVLWILVPLLLPLCDRRRRRIGDWLAGTVVVLEPDAMLLKDVGQIKKIRPKDGEPNFRPEQLDAYGIYEIQVLEELLRDTGRANRSQAMRAVAKQIAKKIHWKEPVLQAEPFLRAFYAACRAHLERKLLLGERRERKRQD